jgi:Mrp family chromosome partitioning ATPase
MRARMTTDLLAHEFRLLRNRIEAEMQAPALLFVTSATAGDGAGFAAHGIAESLSRTHQRTVLITSDPSLAASAPGMATRTPQRRRASDKFESSDNRFDSGDFAVVCLSPERVATISRSRVGEMVQELRSNNDYVVIDAGNLAKNGLGLLLVGSADVAIVAFRSGRAQQEADRLMLSYLERAEARVLGVVMTDQEALEQFAEREKTVRVAERSTEQPRPAAVLKQLELAIARLVKSD